MQQNLKWKQHKVQYLHRWLLNNKTLLHLPPEATVQGQLANISEAINTAVDEGKPIPAFASGAKRIVDAAMQQRGLGASSIAAEALAQGICRMHLYR